MAENIHASPVYPGERDNTRTPALAAAIITDPNRLAALRETGLLDSAVEEVFDRLTRLAVRLLGIPAAFISLVDEHRDFYKSACGFGEPLASMREMTGPTFCHYTVQRTTPLVIPDTAADPIYRFVPTVKTLGVAAYVGIPIAINDQVIGAFCAIDTVPHAWTTAEVEVLAELASSAQREMELRGAVTALRALLDLEAKQRVELERNNQQLQEQAVELEMQAEELQAISAHLEERTEDAEAANRSKSEFLSMMSHELRTPLNAIGGYAELIALGMRGPVTEEQQEFLSRIQRASKHLQMLIADILEFARLDAGRMEFDLRSVGVADAVSESAELLAPQMAEAGLTYATVGLDSGSGGRPLAVHADGDKLKQILVNLLSNAIKFTPAGGSITVECARAGDTMRISVTDTGRGMTMDDARRVFEPFVQVERAATPSRHQGVGLGLAISRGFARGMSGDLSARSEKGKGSTFTLTLPAA